MKRVKRITAESAGETKVKITIEISNPYSDRDSMAKRIDGLADLVMASVAQHKGMSIPLCQIRVI